jgi:hypothetical protein
MSGYLENYGAGQEKRERRLKRVALVAALVVVVGGTSYFFLRNYRETQQAKLFFNLLRNKDYTAAYALWGCTPATPCRDYSMPKFMEDWGPGSGHAELAALQITNVRGCSSGVIIEANFGGGVIEYLWVDREHRNLGFAPFPVCNPVYVPPK